MKPSRDLKPPPAALIFLHGTNFFNQRDVEHNQKQLKAGRLISVNQHGLWVLALSIKLDTVC